MWLSDDWKEYQLLDCTDKEKLERFGSYLLIRPDPQVIWKGERCHPGWGKPDAHYFRSHLGGGEWRFFSLPQQWTIGYSLEEESESSLRFHLKPFRFKHTGLFPEQATNWKKSYRMIKKAKRPIRLLNLFAYTGAATLAAAKAGAMVTHVDASKGMVGWAKENALESGLGGAPIRWIVDDCFKFVEREIRRGQTYDAIILDPPSYGRGPGKEVWKIEDSLYSFLLLCKKILSRRPCFVMISSYTTGLQPGVLQYLLEDIFGSRDSRVVSDEVGLPVSESRLVLPCGATGICSWEP